MLTSASPNASQTIPTEFIAGLSTFIALSYIFVVNPAILAQGGIPTAVSLFATIAISAGATLLMGLWARLPFAVSTGLEMNGYVVFTVIAGLGFTSPQALGLVFWSGALMTAVTVASIREKVIDSIPNSLKIGLSFSVGMFLILIALKLSGILEYKGLMISGIGSFITPGALCLYVGLAATFALESRRIIGSVLISIIAVSIGYHFLAAQGLLGFTPDKAAALPTISKDMFAGVGALVSGSHPQPQIDFRRACPVRSRFLRKRGEIHWLDLANGPAAQWSSAG